jgi:LmbE family N-acetylglucosaminyl deacetylase
MTQAGDIRLYNLVSNLRSYSTTFLTMEEKQKNILIISAHADDHMACAGTVFKLRDKGYIPYEIVLTDSAEGPNNGNGKSKNINMKEIRNSELSEASKYLGIKRTFLFDQPDLGLIYSKKLMFKIMKIIREIKPDIGFIMNTYDWHPDHRETSKIASEAFKWAGSGVKPEFGNFHRTPVVLMAEGMIPVQPNVLVDTTAYSGKKLELWKKYESQATPKLVNFEKSLGDIRGYQLRRKGSLSAEAFTTDPTSPVILFDE